MVHPPVGSNNLITRVQRLAGGRYYEKMSEKVSRTPYCKFFGSVLFIMIIRECSHGSFLDQEISFFRGTLK